MKKLFSYFSLLALFAIVVLNTGCSSAHPKAEAAAAPAKSEAPVMAEKAAPADLGASSSGRGR